MIARSSLPLQPHAPRRLLRALLNSPRALSVSASSPTDAHPPLRTRPVPDAPPELSSSPHAFLKYVRSPTAAPFLLRARSRSDRTADARHELEDALNSSSSSSSSSRRSRADALLRTLRASGDRLVEVEVGRYDKAAGYNRVEVPLGVYLDWLTRPVGDAGEHQGSGGADGRDTLQLYLAQWRARDEVPGLEELVQPPALLAPLLESGAVDLYQTSFFVGPSAMVTPLHYDPYCNLYNVYASSDPGVHAKHFVLFPPALSEYLARADGGSVLRNTSPLDLHLHLHSSRSTPRSASDDAFEIRIDPDSAPLRTREAVLGSGAALSCVVREGDTLFVPRRWWHRVENVALRDATGGLEAEAGGRGWTAGVGWWFLPRTL